MPEDIFADEWRECLRAHYMHVIRTKDRVTEPSLTVVMGQAGFDKSELAELRVRATMHVDESGSDFVPDLDVLEAVAEVDAEARIIAVPAPDLAPTPDEAPPAETELSAELLIEEVEEAAVEAEMLDVAPPPPPPRGEPDAPKQLTLF